ISSLAAPLRDGGYRRHEILHRRRRHAAGHRPDDPRLVGPDLAYKDLDHPVSLKIQSLSNRGRTAARKHFLLPRELAVAVATRYSAVRLEMSALGQKRTLKRFHPMSALPPKADIRTWPSYVWHSSSGSLATFAAIRRVNQSRGDLVQSTDL